MEIICFNIGKPFSKAKYDIQAIVDSTIRERFNSSFIGSLNL